MEKWYHAVKREFLFAENHLTAEDAEIAEKFTEKPSLPSANLALPAVK
jgi:hypothetical protein